MGLAHQVTEPLLTCEAGLAETAFHLGDAALVLDFVGAGLVRDLCLICMGELHPKHSVLTTDLADFRVYWSNRREVIPLIHPPAKS